ncbi:MAG: hypothetical protein KUG78_16075 [Kangiellaceae bacterium]|nr:hypothetical protein [Kangiellaceae bacterium]
MSKFTSSPSKSILSAALVFALGGCITINAKSLDYEDTRKLTTPAGNAKVFEIDAAAGFLKIVGDDSLSEIKITADILAFDDDIELNLESSGDRIELTADANYKNYTNWNGNGPKIDLTIRVPSHIKLEIKDGSGSIEIKEMGNSIAITDGSGSIDILRVKGDLNIDDGSGSLDISDITGNVVIEDGSGSIEIEQVTGTLNIDDGSGGLDVFDIGGLVTIDDGSGGIKLKKLRNGVTIIEEGSGGLSMSDIEGPVTMD